MLGRTRTSTYSGWHLALVADAFGEAAGSLPGDIYEAGVTANLVEHGQSCLGFRQELMIQVGFKLQQGVINSKAVVPHAAGQQHHVLLLAGQALKYLQKLGRGRIQRVIELYFVNAAALFPAKCLFTQIRDLRCTSRSGPEMV